jgi:hypothetical protein
VDIGLSYPEIAAFREPRQMFDAIWALRHRLAPEWFARVTNRAQPGEQISDECNRPAIWPINSTNGH